MKTDIETIKRSQEEMNNIISELKNIVEGIEGGNMKNNNIHIIGIPEGQEEEQGI